MSKFEESYMIFLLSNRILHYLRDAHCAFSTQQIAIP